MNKRVNKILSCFCLLVTLLVVGGFCGAPMAGASSNEIGAKSSSDADNCGMHEKSAIRQDHARSDSVMPCCIERHDNSEIVTPSVFSERVKFYQSADFQRHEQIVLQFAKQKTYFSSPFPPGPDMLSSNIRLE